MDFVKQALQSETSKIIFAYLVVSSQPLKRSVSVVQLQVWEEALPSEQRQQCFIILCAQKALMHEFTSADFMRSSELCSHVLMSLTEPLLCTQTCVVHVKYRDLTRNVFLVKSLLQITLWSQ